MRELFADPSLAYVFVALVIGTSILVHVVIESFRSMFGPRRYPWEPKE